MVGSALAGGAASAAGVSCPRSIVTSRRRNARESGGVGETRVVVAAADAGSTAVKRPLGCAATSSTGNT